MDWRRRAWVCGDRLGSSVVIRLNNNVADDDDEDEDEDEDDVEVEDEDGEDEDDDEDEIG